jgi:ATP-dependent phosphofructokinase / diphosphate-dependent phosphofructokinase
MNLKGNGLYAQSGGVTAVINNSAAGLITAWQEALTRNKDHNLNLTKSDLDDLPKLYAAKNGILGVLNNELERIDNYTHAQIANLRSLPGGKFGSCRYKLKNSGDEEAEYKKLIEIFAKYNIRYFFYNGGNDSADTCLKVSNISKKLGYLIQCIHIPKTVDNDLVATDNCPGFGSVIKYLATSVLEASIDLSSMYRTSTKVFILEVMGRHAGWIAAGTGLASKDSTKPPHIILFPEIKFDQDKFLAKVQEVIALNGYCVVVAAEGIKDSAGDLIAASKEVDAFGHAKLGGVANILADIVTNKLNLKCHYAIPDYLQRSARHLASQVDVDQAFAVGESAVVFARKGFDSIMVCIERISNAPYQWQIQSVSLEQVANKEKFMPRDFMDKEGYAISPKCREYLSPLIVGECYPPYANGLPAYL